MTARPDLKSKTGILFSIGYYEPAGHDVKRSAQQLAGGACAKIAPSNNMASTPVKRELNFVQDYFVTLYTKMSALPSANFPIVGCLVRQDFIDLSNGLEKTACTPFSPSVP
jgi:hypothetical protein